MICVVTGLKSLLPKLRVFSSLRSTPTLDAKDCGQDHVKGEPRRSGRKSNLLSKIMGPVVVGPPVLTIN